MIKDAEVFGDCPFGLAQIVSGTKRLVIYYNKLRWGLYRAFSSDLRVREYIYKNANEAFCEAVERYNEDTYMLNIASVDNYGAFPHGIPDKSILDEQLEIFMPIIKKFMVDALTDNLPTDEI